MNNITLTQTSAGHWYEVIDGHHYLVNGTTIRIEDINNVSIFVCGESLYDEMGIMIPVKEADKIMVKELVF